jgi:dihydrofolate reductase
MEGSTTFHFVTDGPEAALARAREAAEGKDVRIGGGVSMIRQYLIDEMHLAVSPVLLGGGEHLFGGLDLPTLGYVPCITTPRDGALHVVIRRMERIPNGEES